MMVKLLQTINPCLCRKDNYIYGKFKSRLVILFKYSFKAFLKTILWRINIKGYKKELKPPYFIEKMNINYTCPYNFYSEILKDIPLLSRRLIRKVLTKAAPGV